MTRPLHTIRPVLARYWKSGRPQYHQYHFSVLNEALETQLEEIVRSAASGALGKIGTNDAKATLKKFLSQDSSASVRSEMRCAVDSM